MTPALDPDSLDRGKRGVNAGDRTPRRIATPPPAAAAAARARLEVKHNVDQGGSRHVASAARDNDLIARGGHDVDADDDNLHRAIARTQREATPGASPSRKRQRINGDRYGDETTFSVPWVYVMEADCEITDSYPVELAKISKQATACMTQARLRVWHASSALLMAS